MILMIDNYDSFTYNLVQLFRSLGADMEVRTNDEIDVEGIKKLNPSAIVLSPGPSCPDNAGVTLAAIKEFAGKVPILGICLGHQSIAQAFGGKVVHAKSLMHGKTSPIKHDGKGLFKDCSQGMAAMRYHSLAVERETLPDCFEISAETLDGEIMGLRHKTMMIESLQYHPESVGTPEGPTQIANWLETVRNCGTRKSVDFDEVFAGKVSEEDLTAYLLAHKGYLPTVDELVSAAQAMRKACVKVCAPEGAVDIVGTGGDGYSTFNVSTTAAFIAAGAGVTIAKHGNIASTSKSGSADCLRSLGYDLKRTLSEVEKDIANKGIGFCFANACHPAMRFVAPVRRKLGFRTIFNLLGPLTNPAGVTHHALGVYSPEVAELYVEALKRLGAKRAVVFCGEGNMDEVTPWGTTKVWILDEGIVKNEELRMKNEELVDGVRGGTPEVNARITEDILSGTDRSVKREMAVLNAAMAIMAAGTKSFAEATAMAMESLDSGKALQKMKELVV